MYVIVLIKCSLTTCSWKRSSELWTSCLPILRNDSNVEKALSDFRVRPLGTKKIDKINL